MNLDDESLLSAYLDGELSPAERLRVEAALLERPGLAERVQELSAVRGLVRGLPRPTAPFDAAAGVTSRIAAMPLVRWRVSWRRAGWKAPAAVAAAAAVLLTSVGLLVLSYYPRGEPPRTAPRIARAATTPAPVAVRPPEEPPPVRTAESQPTPPAVNVAAQPPVDPHSRDRDRLRALLERPDVRRMLVVVDTITTDDRARIEQSIAETGRQEPVRAQIHIGQGLIIDPERPGESYVYTIVMDDAELARFRQVLSARFPESVGPVEPVAPEVITQLGEVGQVLVRDDPPAPPYVVEAPVSGGEAALLTRLDPHTVSQPPAPSRRPAPAEPAAPLPPNGPRRVYLIWLTTATVVREGSS